MSKPNPAGQPYTYPEAQPAPYSAYSQPQQGYAQPASYGSPTKPSTFAPPPQQGYNENDPSKYYYNNGAPPMAPPAGVPAQPSYYDYTVPQNFGSVMKFKGTDHWETIMWCAPCREPCYFIGACFFPCCCTYLQRRTLLMDDWSRYVCCAGVCCGMCCRCDCCTTCGPCCLCLESFMCMPCAVSGNRFMVRQHYNLGAECCDILILVLSFVLLIVALILQNDCVRGAADCFNCIVIPCMLAQSEHQMKVKGYPRRIEMM